MCSVEVLAAAAAAKVAPAVVDLSAKTEVKGCIPRGCIPLWHIGQIVHIFHNAHSAPLHSDSAASTASVNKIMNILKIVWHIF